MEQQIIICTNNHQLSGVLHIPSCNENEKKPALVMCHGFIGSKVGQHRMFVKTARLLCLAGFIVLRFDFSGCGESSGEYRNITITEQVEETRAAIDALVTHPNVDLGHITLVGHSLGGAIAASVAAQDKRIDQLILLSPVANPFADIVHIVGAERYQECLEKTVVNYAGFEIGWEFFLSLSQARPLDNIHTFPGKVLLVHGSEDEDTLLENSYQYQYKLDTRLRGHCALHIVKGADHTYNSPLWEREVQEVIMLWLAP